MKVFGHPSHLISVKCVNFLTAKAWSSLRQKGVNAINQTVSLSFRVKIYDLFTRIQTVWLSKTLQLDSIRLVRPLVRRIVKDLESRHSRGEFYSLKTFHPISLSSCSFTPKLSKLSLVNWPFWIENSDLKLRNYGKLIFFSFTVAEYRVLISWRVLLPLALICILIKNRLQTGY